MTNSSLQQHRAVNEIVPRESNNSCQNVNKSAKTNPNLTNYNSSLVAEKKAAACTHKIKPILTKVLDKYPSEC